MIESNYFVFNYFNRFSVFVFRFFLVPNQREQHHFLSNVWPSRHFAYAFIFIYKSFFWLKIKYGRRRRQGFFYCSPQLSICTTVHGRASPIEFAADAILMANGLALLCVRRTARCERTFYSAIQRSQRIPRPLHLYSIVDVDIRVCDGFGVKCDIK